MKILTHNGDAILVNGDAIQQSDEWKRPSEWAQYTPSLVEGEEVVFVTIDRGIESAPTQFKLGLFCNETSYPNYYLEIGHIVNGTFVVDSQSRGKPVIEEVVVDLSNYQDRYLCCRLRLENSGYTIKNISATGINNYEWKSSPIVEIYANGSNIKKPDYFWNTQSITYKNAKFNNLSKAFAGNTNNGDNAFNLQHIDIKDCDFSDATNLSNMFDGCVALKKVDLSNVDFTLATNLSSMFLNCVQLKEVNLSGCTLPVASNLSSMFSGCCSLEKVDLNNTSITSVTNIGQMFNNCQNIKTLDLSNISFENCTSLYNLFYGCSNLKEVDMSINETTTMAVNQANYWGRANIFLATLNLDGWDLENYTSNNFFAGLYTKCLQTLYPPIMHYSFTLNVPTLDKSSLLRVIDKLATTQTTQTATLGATNLAKLTNAEKQVAIDKGWTLA